jgi:hypothetical protein
VKTPSHTFLLALVFVSHLTFTIEANSNSDVPHDLARVGLIFDIVVLNACRATSNGKENAGLKKLVNAGIHLDESYFDIICPENGYIFPTTLAVKNYQSARNYLEYLRQREIETGDKTIRMEILNTVNTSGETLVDYTHQYLLHTTDRYAQKQYNRFLKLFAQHGGTCKKYCNVIELNY